MRHPLLRSACLLLSALATISLSVAAAYAQQSPSGGAASTPPDRVEEDWQLVVANPDPTGVGPQVTTCMSPVSDGSAPFVALDMNYREFPVFYPGGMQLQVWSGNRVIGTSAQGSALFNTPNETVTWTQRMRLYGNFLFYDIENGQSTTWGQFGQEERLMVAYATGVTSLADYDPDVSAAASGVSWEQNRVTSLTLLRVRYYAAGQLLWTDNNPRQVVAPPATIDGGDMP